MSRQLKLEKCVSCNKSVYPVEKMCIDENRCYHKHCFRCAHCNTTLKLGNYASLEGKVYCKPHFTQLFRLKGNYDEGFGREKISQKVSVINKSSPSKKNNQSPPHQHQQKQQQFSHLFHLVQMWVKNSIK